MALVDTFREVAIAQAPVQEVLIDAVTEEAPILASIPMEETSNGWQNVYERISSVDGAQLVSLDEALPSIDVISETSYVEISKIGGKIEVGVDKASKFGGASAYFAKQLPTVLRETGAKTEQSLLYNNIRVFAKSNDKLFNALGTGGGSIYTSMLCVKWVSGETTGLYDPDSGDAFKMDALSGGYPYLNSDDIEVRGMTIKNFFGLQLANPKYVSGIANIDLRADSTSDTGYKFLPTEAQVNKMLSEARANPGNTLIYCHPNTLNALGIYKGGALQIGLTEGNYNNQIVSWNGVRFLPSYNFLLTEPEETFA